MNHDTARRSEVSAWAVAALVLGILAVALLLAAFGGVGILALVCGHAGLADVKRKRCRGRGLAIAGLVLGYFTVAATVVRAFA